jgi:hypothetical protein
MATATAPSGKIHAAMCDILGELDAIGKNARNQQQGFNYRGIDDVYNAINPLLAKHRVYMTAQVIGKTREERTNAKGTVLAFTCLHMRYRFVAEDGSFAETEAEGEGMDSGDKSSNKSMAVAHKYALLQAFCIPTKDLDDPDAETHEVAPAQRAEQSRPAPAPDKERARKAADWCYEAKSFVLQCGTREKLDAWHRANSNNIAAAKPLAPNAHAALLEAIEKREGDLHPMAAE